MTKDAATSPGGLTVFDSEAPVAAPVSEAASDGLDSATSGADGEDEASEGRAHAMAAREPLLSEIIMHLIRSVRGWTDLHIAPACPVRMRRSSFRWEVAPAADGNPIYVSAAQITAFLNGIYQNVEMPNLFDNSGKIVSPKWVADLDEQKSLHPAHFLAMSEGSETVYARIRVSVQVQGMGESVVLVVRHLPDVPRDTRILGLPIQVNHMCKQPHRLIIVTGPTGAGKSTTIAGMIQEINTTRHANIQTIEDPIEYMYEESLSIINQREVGVDVQSFADGVRDALRFVPDVIVIGEIRDAATARAALRAGESGHLVIASMHAPTVFGAIRSLLAMVAGDAEGIALGNAIVGVIAQALLPGVGDEEQTEGYGNKVLAYEVISQIDRSMREAISKRDGVKFSEIEAKFNSESAGINAIPMSATVVKLAREGRVAPEVALALCQDGPKRNELRSMIDNGVKAGAKP